MNYENKSRNELIEIINKRNKTIETLETKNNDIEKKLNELTFEGITALANSLKEQYQNQINLINKLKVISGFPTPRTNYTAFSISYLDDHIGVFNANLNGSNLLIRTSSIPLTSGDKIAISGIYLT